MATHYIQWTDAKALLDPDVYKDFEDHVVLTERCARAEERFDARLQRRYAVPFDVDLNPEAFAIAVRVCSRWAAASYIRWANQAEGTEAQQWYANDLEREAEEALELLETQRAPDDASAASDPVVETFYDEVTTEATAHVAWFGRKRATPGNNSHW